MTVLFDNILFGGGGRDTHNKGWFATPQALSAAYPTANPGDFAVVGSTDTIWVWNATSSTWKDTDTKGQVSSVNNETGDVTLDAADVGACYTLEGLGVTSQNVSSKTLLDSIVAKNLPTGCFVSGGVELTDFPTGALSNAEILINLKKSTLGMVIYDITLSSINVAPYIWYACFQAGQSDNVTWVSSTAPQSTKEDTSFITSGNVPNAITFSKLTPIVYYTAGTNSTLAFNSFTASDVTENGVYTWELICSSSNAITGTTYGASIQYVGNDKAYNPSLAFPLIDNTRTAHVFTVRLIKNGATSSWMFAYNYSFKG